MKTLQRDPAALVQFIDSRHATAHAVGTDANDCVAFALEAAYRQTGQRRAARLRWTTLAQGMRIIARFGSLEAAFDHYFQRIAPAQAMRGDIAGVPVTPARDGLKPAALLDLHVMLVEGATLVGPGDSGNRRLPRSCMVCAWSVTLPRPPAHEPGQPRARRRKEKKAAAK